MTWIPAWYEASVGETESKKAQLNIPRGGGNLRALYSVADE